MTALKKNMKETRLAFDFRLFGISTTITSEKRGSYMAAFDLDDVRELEQHKTIIKEGLELFNSLFEHSPQAFVSPNGILHISLEPFLASLGIKQFQTATLGFSPKGNGAYKKRICFQGKTNKCGQCYTTRNCIFEPCTSSSTDWVHQCLGQIETAFKWKKPAIICSHRVNYIGYIDPSNRDKNLKLLKQLFNQILKHWPDVEFLNSVQLGNLISNSTK
jgi:hypothetical protein